MTDHPRARLPEGKNRLRVAVLMTNAVLFGAGLIVVLTLPALSAHAAIGIPVVVVASLLLAAPVAWLIAPRLQARYSRRRVEQGR